METLIRGAAVVSVACLGILIAVTLAALLRMGAVRPHARLSESIRRSWLGFPLLLLFVCGLVQYGSTKGDGWGRRRTIRRRRPADSRPNCCAECLRSDGFFAPGGYSAGDQSLPLGD